MDFYSSKCLRFFIFLNFIVLTSLIVLLDHDMQFLSLFTYIPFSGCFNVKMLFFWGSQQEITQMVTISTHLDLWCITSTVILKYTWWQCAENTLSCATGNHTWWTWDGAQFLGSHCQAAILPSRYSRYQVLYLRNHPIFHNKTLEFYSEWNW